MSHSSFAVRAQTRRLALVGFAACLVLVGCASEGEPEAVTQDTYLESAHAFEEERAGYAETITECAAEQGVEVETTWDHGVVLPEGLEEEEIDEYWQVVEGCAGEVYPPERDPSPEEVEDQYALLLAAKECLEDEGHETTESSGIEDFQAAYESGGSQQPWSPYEIIAQEPEAFREAVEVCPQPGRF